VQQAACPLPRGGRRWAIVATHMSALCPAALGGGRQLWHQLLPCSLKGGAQLAAAALASLAPCNCRGWGARRGAPPSRQHPASPCGAACVLPRGGRVVGSRVGVPSCVCSRQDTSAAEHQQFSVVCVCAPHAMMSVLPCGACAFTTGSGVVRMAGWWLAGAAACSSVRPPDLMLGG
jgi:hypothetical protein